MLDEAAGVASRPSSASAFLTTFSSTFFPSLYSTALASSRPRRTFGFLGGRNNPRQRSPTQPAPHPAPDSPAPHRIPLRFFRPSTASVPRSTPSPPPQHPLDSQTHPPSRHSVAYSPRRTPAKSNTVPSPLAQEQAPHSLQRRPTEDVSLLPPSATSTASRSMTAEHPPTRASLRAWWQNFTSAQKSKAGQHPGRYDLDKSGVSSPSFVTRLALMARCGMGWVRGGGAPCVWETVEGELEVCECADIDGKFERGAVCMGIYTRRRSEVVRSQFLDSYSLSSRTYVVVSCLPCLQFCWDHHLVISPFAAR